MIKFILVTFLIFLFIRMVAPWLIRWLLGAFIRKKMRNGTFFYSNMHQQQQRQEQPNNGQNGRGNGNVKIDYMPEQPKRSGFDGGEYVDYEEVK